MSEVGAEVDAGSGSGGGKAGAMTSARAWWQTLGARDRRLLLAGAAERGRDLLWAVAVQPAWRTIDRAAAERDSLDRQWQTMQRLAEEAKELRGATPVSQPQAVAALQAATARLGSAGRLVLQGDRAVLTLNGVGTGALRDWLAEARSGARARPLEANLARAAQGYSGTLVMVLEGGT
jgi:general secretion pathway protein M